MTEEILAILVQSELFGLAQRLRNYAIVLDSCNADYTAAQVRTESNNLLALHDKLKLFRRNNTDE